MRTDLADDHEVITSVWLNEWAEQQQFCWNLPGTELIIARSRAPLKCDLWVILNEELDGTETVLCDARNRGDVREYLESLGSVADGAELLEHVGLARNT
jgi:hypothetical protein